jgi:hypothetical protein
MSSNHSARQTTVPKAGERLANNWVGTDFAQLRQRIRDLVDDLMRDVLDAVSMASAVEIGGLIGILDSRRDRDGTPSNLDRARARAAGVPSRPDRAVARAAHEPSRLDRVTVRAAEMTSTPGERASSPKRDGGGRAGDPYAARRRGRSRLLPHSPFDITSPSELLASTGIVPVPPAATAPPSGQASGRSAASFDRATPRGGDLLDGRSPRLDPTAARAADATSAPPGRGRDPNDASSSGQEPAATDSSITLSASDAEAASERRPKVVLREGERLLSATGSGVVIRRERRFSPRH